MKPETIKNISQIDFDSLSTDEISALIKALTAEYEERQERARRRKKAEEYECKIYDLLSEALQDDFKVLISGGPLITKNSVVDVYD